MSEHDPDPATTSPDPPVAASPPVAADDVLPRPTTERWQPLRLGLVDLFYYDDEQFWFHDGRLLLRGNNGTGKSKVLALTLPFLLDGSAHPRRVEPDADPKKRMEWNLLLGGAHASTERTGYSWVEFGRLDPAGSEHFTTLVIGLKAAAGRGIVKTWFAITSRRIGELHLVDEHRTALTQERLRDELEGTRSGRVFPTRESYRRAVDEALFRLGEERYDALVDLLIQLRQPQLSKKPDEKALSAALTEALAPLDQAVVADVAESFRSLEEERAGITEARETLRAATEFLGHYRVYARVAAGRRTSAVRESNSAFEQAGRTLREAETDLEGVAVRIRALDEEQTAAEDRRGELEGREQALRSSPEMRDAEHLDRAGREAAEAEERAGAAESDAEQAGVRATRDTELEAAATMEADEAAELLLGHTRRAARLAGPTGLAADHAVLTTDEAAGRRALARRREQVGHVRTLVQSARTAQETAGRRRSDLDHAEGDQAGRAEELADAEVGVEAAVEAHGEDVSNHLAGLRVLRVEADVEDLLARARTWARGQSGESPARAAIETAAAVARDRIGRQRATAEQTLGRLEEELAGVDAEIEALEAGRDPEPPPVPGRDPAPRADRPGAPLWRLTDFAPEVDETARAGLEAALQSAGLLDAWVFPDGTVRADGEVVLGPRGRPVADSLAGWLRPATGPDDAVGAEAVDGVLSRLGLGEGSGAALWVDPAGGWGAGPARGSWHKPRAEYVGAGARETSRRERVTTLTALAAELGRRQVAERARIAEADDLARLVGEESGRYPHGGERAVVQAHASVAAAGRELERAGEAVDAARSRWQQAEAQAEQAGAELVDQAAQLRLGTTTTDLDATGAAIAAYELALVQVRHAAASLARAGSARDQAVERAAETAATAARRSGAARTLRTAASGLRARFEELAATVGATVAQLQTQLGEVASAQQEVAAALRVVAQQRIEVAARQGTLEQKVADLELRRTETAAGRERQVGALREFAATGLLRVALPELETPDAARAEEWTVTAALALARTSHQLLEGVDESEDAWSRSQQRVSKASTDLTSQMSRHGHTVSVEQHGDVIVPRVRYLGDEIDVDRLADRLTRDVADRERLLSAREREILENHLVNEVAGHLHELLGAAEDQIEGMNRELAERRTSTGMQLRVRWRERPDGPAGLAATRQLMLRSDATWTAADRTAIGDFLQAQIAAARQADPAGGWLEHLEQALDYRQWHSFAVERHQNGQWRSASGPASGGEKALTVSVPLFAAASAHYNSAGTLAPRLILLDEAFAGVDDDSRAKSLGLLATFDLDVVMTSEREWGCYPQVPGLAIAQLSRVEGVEAVGVTRWRWDGRRRARLGEVGEPARAGAAAEVPDDDTLFG